MNIKLNEGIMFVKIRRIVFAAMVAAIYVALTLSLLFFSFGVFNIPSLRDLLF